MIRNIPSNSFIIENLSQAKENILQNLNMEKEKLPKSIQEEQFSYFRKYFGETIKKTIKKDNYPLDCFLFREIYQMGKQINKLGDKLKKIEEKFGESFLQNLIEELKGKHGVEFSIKLHSLAPELSFAFLLSKLPGSCSLQKIKEKGKGDLLFRCDDDKWYIEIKRAFDEDFSLYWIEEALYGSLFLKKNAVLKRLNKVFLEGEGVNHSFRNKAIEFIHDDMLRIILQIMKDCKERGFKDLSWEMKKYVINNGKQQSIMNIRISGYNNVIEILLSLDEAGETEKRNLKIRMKQEKNSPHIYSISYNNVYWVDKKYLIKEKLYGKLAKKCKEIKKQVDSNNAADNKAGLIQLDIHPKHEAQFISETFREELKHFLDQEIRETPCIIFPTSLFEQFDPILNKAAENSIFNQLRNKS